MRKPLLLLRALLSIAGASAYRAQPGTPLNGAAAHGRLDDLQAALAAGANPTAREDRERLTALMCYGDAESVRLPRAAGANPRLATSGGVTALEAAVGGATDIDRFTVGSCQTDAVRALLRTDQALKLPDTSGGRSSHRIAKHIGRCADVIALLDGANHPAPRRAARFNLP